MVPSSKGRDSVSPPPRPDVANHCLLMLCTRNIITISVYMYHSNGVVYIIMQVSFEGEDVCREGILGGG